ncbi:MAG: hypothetical protein J6U42_03215 [Lachnospiraceae bacterium]|nr:hypothetical protein [Lachnospiraceae bacterium]
MYCKTITCARSGNETILLSVEADMRNGLPGFPVCGAVSQEMKESKERVRIALENAGFLMPPKRITVNLSPETKKNDRSSPDLAITLSVLSAYGYIPESFLNDIAVIGDLSLDGGVKPVKGVFSYACEAERYGIKRIIVPFENGMRPKCCIRKMMDCALENHLFDIYPIRIDRVHDHSAKLGKHRVFGNRFQRALYAIFQPSGALGNRQGVVYRFEKLLAFLTPSPIVVKIAGLTPLSSWMIGFPSIS